MSYDLMVFNIDTAPKEKDAFFEWYEVQTAWTEKHNYKDPKNTSEELKVWYYEMTKTFPAIQEYEDTEDNSNTLFGDYTIGREMIYASFPWSSGYKAFKQSKHLAYSNQLGLYDISGSNIVYFSPFYGGPVLVKLHQFYGVFGLLTTLSSLVFLFYGLLSCELNELGFVFAFFLLISGI